MKRKILFILVIVVIAVFISCNDMGTPPDLVLSFTINAKDNGGDTYDVNYTLSNDGDDDLENCKIQFGLDKDDNQVYDDYKFWTAGVDLAVGESDTTTANIPVGSYIYGVTVLAAGFDNPPDPESSPGRTIIYYGN
jgi:hypothetical protein